MTSERKVSRDRRHQRVRRKVSGTTQRPRLSVYKSLQFIYAQLIDDVTGATLVSASSQEPELRTTLASRRNLEAAKAVGALLGRRAQEVKITMAVFDRGGFPYHGRVKALADAAREAGLSF